jgi:hypothetical protein
MPTESLLEGAVECGVPCKGDYLTRVPASEPFLRHGPFRSFAIGGARLSDAANGQSENQIRSLVICAFSRCEHRRRVANVSFFPLAGARSCARSKFKSLGLPVAPQKDPQSQLRGR